MRSEELSYLTVCYIGFDGAPYVGEVIVKELYGLSRGLVKVLEGVILERDPELRQLLADGVGAPVGVVNVAAVTVR